MASKGRILCVDDHPDICDLVRTILKNYEIVFARSKAEGIREVESGWYDLYLLDHSLPDGTGLELAALIRQFDDFTPILFISTRHTLTDISLSEVRAQGRVSIDDFPDDLLTKVSRILNQP